MRMNSKNRDQKSCLSARSISRNSEESSSVSKVNNYIKILIIIVHRLLICLFKSINLVLHLLDMYLKAHNKYFRITFCSDLMCIKGIKG